jgi:hypothetical protein
MAVSGHLVAGENHFSRIPSFGVGAMVADYQR